MIIICDIDKTLADNAHREHYLLQPKKDWDSFFKAASEDTVIWPIRDLIVYLKDNHRIVFLTGRPDKYHIETAIWLRDNGIVNFFRPTSHKLIFRPNNNYEKDYIFKSRVVQELGLNNIWFAIDDSPEVIKAYRELGIFTIDPVQHKG